MFFLFSVCFAIIAAVKSGTLFLGISFYGEDNSINYSNHLRNIKQEKSRILSEWNVNLIAEKINDVLRYTMVYDEDNLTQAYFDTIDLLKKKKYNVIKVKNTFVKNAPYKGINMILSTGKGDNFELQFHTPYSLEVKEKKLHKLYEIQRKLDKVKEDVQYKALTKQMIKISDTILHPIDVERIK